MLAKWLEKSQPSSQRGPSTLVSNCHCLVPAPLSARFPQDARNGYASEACLASLTAHGDMKKTTNKQTPNQSKKITSDIESALTSDIQTTANHSISQHNRKIPQNRDKVKRIPAQLKGNENAALPRPVKALVINHGTKEHLAACWHNTAFWHLPLCRALHCCQWEFYILNNSRMCGSHSLGECGF